MKGRRWSLVVAGVLCLSAPAVAVAVGIAAPGAQADDTAGSGFGTYSLSATAPGMQVTYDFPLASGHPQAEGEVPESVAQLLSGPQGYALATVAWPGSLAANAGSTSQLLGLPIPSQTANQLNEPVRAEARTGSGPSTVTNDQYPGTTMVATATPALVTSDATLAGSSGPAPGSSTGTTETTSTTKLTGPTTAVGTAMSRVDKVSLAGGAVTIDSVISTASGTTNGTTASASGGTTVSGMHIGGVPATIDQNGLHIGQVGAPTSAVATAIANQALNGAGMKIAVSLPSTIKQGANVTYTAGTVVFYWAPPGDSHDDTFTATFGGASVALGAAPATAVSLGLPPVAAVGGSSTSASPSSPAVASAPSVPSVPSVASVPSAAPTGGGATTPVSGVFASQSAGLPGGLSPAWIIFTLLGAGLLGAGLRRLPDRVLEEPATICTEVDHVR